jgi:bifunctional DNA-binding transcriptional regulator/antitoxin component of YhaV-PrlF toxin-antitoxin module
VGGGLGELGGAQVVKRLSLRKRSSAEDRTAAPRSRCGGRCHRIGPICAPRVRIFFLASSAMSTTVVLSSYPLLLMPKVKGQTKISIKNQVTIPVAALRDAGMRAGDVLRAEADGAGRLVLTRVDEVLARYSGALKTDGRFGESVRGVREEWR